MHKRAKFLLLFVELSLLSLFLVTVVLAEPTAPVNVVNHKTKQCAMISTGDECQTCVPTGDWEILKGDCPEGYTKLDKYVQSSCTFTGKGNPICCYMDPRSCKNSLVNPNTKYFFIGLVIIALLSTIVIMLEKSKAVHD